MLTIDGARGEGGGQILRSALALSAVTGTAVRIQRIRAGREKPGLLPQHLAAVRAAAQISEADVDGDRLGARELVFRPRRVRPGAHHFAVGTAGSATLVLQTVLPPLLLADTPSRLSLEGGTHNRFAPSFDFLSRAFLPLIARMGRRVTATLERPGFYPAGGGRFTIDITPVPGLTPLALTERGLIRRRHARPLVARLPVSIADREVPVGTHLADQLLLPMALAGTSTLRTLPLTT